MNEAPPPVAAEPFVGLRPYERLESHLLTGRGNDARFLVDKVFASRLVLLYAPSGMGKSSLLRALVIPEFERETCRVVMFDAWACESPERALKQALLARASAIGLWGGFDASASLLDMARLLTADRQTLVLVLDQFEEFLLNHAQALDPLRKELATLVRAPDLDVRLLVSLREEFLANLEPFREEIVGLFQSTYRLEPLNAEQVKNAVREPAQAFGKECERALLDQLVIDLSAAPAAGGVDLPMLQIVCQEMWRAAVNRQQPALTLAFYKNTLGGAAAILDAYLHKVMPRGWADQVFTARLMTHLAPASGRKIPFALSDLGPMTRLNPARIERELRRLASPEVRVLRVREFAGAETFELQHDALIARIAPWRDRWLRRWQQARRAAVLALVLAAVAVAAGVNRVRDNREIDANTQQLLEPLHCGTPDKGLPSAPAALDNVAGYLLNPKRGNEGLARLKPLFQRYEDCIPPGYGRPGIEAGNTQTVGANERWPLVLKVSDRRNLDDTTFLQVWLGAASRLTGQFAIPVPRRLKLLRDPLLPASRVQLLADGEPVLDFDLAEPDGAAADGGAMVRMAKGSPQAEAFRQHFEADWKPWDAWADVDNSADAARWLRVPRWSLPAWKALGVDIFEPGSVLALALERMLAHEPAKLLTAGAQRSVWQAIYPFCKRERNLNEPAPTACEPDAPLLRKLSAGRDGLRHAELAINALAGLTNERRAAGMATMLSKGFLASLAQAPLQPLQASAPVPATLPKDAERAKTTPNTRLAPVLRKAPPPATELATAQARLRSASSDPRAYDEVAHWLPAPLARLRVVLGADLVQAWGADGGRLPPQALEAIGQARDRVFRDWGIVLPEIRFRAAAGGEAEHGRDVHVAVLDEVDRAVPALRLPADDRAAFAALLARVTQRVVATRAAWVSQADVSRVVAAAPGELQQWLAQHRLPRELTLIARAALLLEPAAAETGAATLRHGDWLLASLPAWELLADPAKRTAGAAAGFLRELQRARAALPAAAAGSDAEMDAAARLLAEGKVSDAQRLLAAALATDRGDKAALRARFVRAYAAAFRPWLQASVRQRCADPAEPDTANPLRLRADVEELLVGKGERPDPAQTRHLLLCRAAAFVGDDRVLAHLAATSEAAAGGPADEWTPTQAQWLGSKLMLRYEPLRDAPAMREQGQALLSSALRRLPADKAYDVFGELRTRCGDGGGPRNWCWQVLQTLAEQLPANPWVAIDMALSRVDQPPLAGVGSAAEWVAKAQQRVLRAALTPPQRQSLQGWTRQVRAQIRYEATRAGDPAALAALDQEAADMGAVSTDAALVEQALLLRTRIGVLKQFNLAQGEEVARRAAAQYPNNPEFLTLAFIAALAQGRIDAAKAHLTWVDTRLGLLPAGDESRDALLFISALGRTLTGVGEWEIAGRRFLQTRHPYVNLVAMLMSSRLSNAAGRSGVEAERLIRQRWRVVDPGSWPQRMAVGDASAWYERLLGAYLGEVKRDVLLADLADRAAFDRSQLAHLPFNLATLRGDAYFYDAIRLQRAGDKPAMRQSLQQVVSLGQPDTFEYHMARYLLSLP